MLEQHKRILDELKEYHGSQERHRSLRSEFDNCSRLPSRLAEITDRFPDVFKGRWTNAKYLDWVEGQYPESRIRRLKEFFDSDECKENVLQVQEIFTNGKNHRNHWNHRYYMPY